MESPHDIKQRITNQFLALDEAVTVQRHAPRVNGCASSALHSCMTAALGQNHWQGHISMSSTFPQVNCCSLPYGQAGDSP